MSKGYVIRYRVRFEYHAANDASPMDGIQFGMILYIAVLCRIS